MTGQTSDAQLFKGLTVTEIKEQTGDRQPFLSQTITFEIADNFVDRFFQ